MKMCKLQLVLSVILMLNVVAVALPINPAARRVIPSAFQQIISVDYRSVRESNGATALKAAVLPKTLGDFEKALISVGVNPQKDLESLTFASFRDRSRELKRIGIASGSFSLQAILANVAAQNPQPMSYQGSSLYLMMKATDPKSKDLDMTFLDNKTLLFGEREALELALGVRNGDTPAMDANRRYSDLIRDLEKAPVWSVLNGQGSREMLLFALGDASKEEEYADVKKRVLGADYAMNFEDGLKFDLGVLTLDPESSSALSSLLKEGSLFKKVKSNAGAKIASTVMSADEDALGLEIHFKVDREQMQKLLEAHFFDVLSDKPKVQPEMTHP